MIDTSGFYSLNNVGRLLYAPNIVSNKNFVLEREKKDIYPYPIDGWKWFDSRALAVVELLPMSDVVNISPTTPKPKTAITSQQFIFRFTGTEYTAILTTIDTDPVLKSYIDVLVNAPWVDLKSNVVNDGVTLLINRGILTPERASEIVSIDKR